jgi:hypothetical protein
LNCTLETVRRVGLRKMDGRPDSTFLTRCSERAVARSSKAAMKKNGQIIPPTTARTAQSDGRVLSCGKVGKEQKFTPIQ